jgi:hypothetical protein
MPSMLLELRARGHRDQTVTGGIALSGAGVLAFASAVAALGAYGRSNEDHDAKGA